MAAQTVMVACKAPNGLILNLDQYEKTDDKNNVRRIDGAMEVTLKGWSRPFNAPDMTEGGYALTAVPADFWDAWIAKNAKSPLVVNKVVLGPHKDFGGQAKDHAAVPQMFRPAREGDVPGIRRNDKDA